MPSGSFVLRLIESATVNLQQFRKHLLDLPEAGSDILPTRLSSPIQRRGDMQSLLQTLQRFIYSIGECIWLCT